MANQKPDHVKSMYSQSLLPIASLFLHFQRAGHDEWPSEQSHYSLVPHS